MMGVLASFWIAIGCLTAFLLALCFPQWRFVAAAAGIAASCAASLLIGPLPAPPGSALLFEMTVRMALLALVPVLLSALIGAWFRRKLIMEM